MLALLGREGVMLSKNDEGEPAPFAGQAGHRRGAWRAESRNAGIRTASVALQLGCRVSAGRRPLGCQWFASRCITEDLFVTAIAVGREIGVNIGSEFTDTYHWTLHPQNGGEPIWPPPAQPASSYTQMVRIPEHRDHGFRLIVTDDSGRS